MTAWIDYATRSDVVRRSGKVALLVGTILVAINYGDRLLGGNLSARDLVKILLTFCVPYCVSTYASVSALRGASRGDGEAGQAG
ncbi:MAG: nitrate/nitrite transporter NrtS [Gammaproteobacteria bacterium]|nr:nitrate/nitrite transporter NrtS [Gammaproteobacteria bacterium]MCP5199460.1 nitrate/nitrite transporter NrtS [Gammaproteobacteria bacterium]